MRTNVRSGIYIKDNKFINDRQHGKHVNYNFGCPVKIILKPIKFEFKLFSIEKNLFLSEKIEWTQHDPKIYPIIKQFFIFSPFRHISPFPLHIFRITNILKFFLS